MADDAYFDGQVAQRTIEDLRRLKQGGKPFFLACGFIRPHLPFYAPKKYRDLYERGQIDIADNRYRPKNAPRELRSSGEFRSYHLADTEVEQSQTWWIQDSENHHANHFTTCWKLAGILTNLLVYMDKPFKDGHPPSAHHEAWTKRNANRRPNKKCSAPSSC